MTWLLLALQLYTPTLAKDRAPEVLLEGSWISCPEGDTYAEKAYQFKFKGAVLFELHMGPRDEFALFAGGWDDDIPHTDKRNLLGPAFHYNDVPTVAGGRNWSSMTLGVHFNAIALPPSYDDCYSFVVKLEKDTSPIWAQR